MCIQNIHDVFDIQKFRKKILFYFILFYLDFYSFLIVLGHFLPKKIRCRLAFAEELDFKKSIAPVSSTNSDKTIFFHGQFFWHSFWTFVTQ